MATCPGEQKPAGLGSIAEQTIDHKVDVLMGGGKARFDQTTFQGTTVVQQAQAAGYQLATDQAGLDAATANKPFLGLFASGNMDLEWTGPLAAPYPGPAPTVCTESNPARPATQPHLSAMTKKAIELLDPKSGNGRRGFFLQVEGASIDKQDHAANACGQIGENIEFDNAIQRSRGSGRSTTRTRSSSSPPTTVTRVRSSKRSRRPITAPVRSRR